eukprot:TCALIF_04970-PA protein Name:"Protein of unknown function" AED:0.03 eAED:0.18 QI:0/0.66/0.71/0.85/0.83/0.85/7/60/336
MSYAIHSDPQLEYSSVSPLVPLDIEFPAITDASGKPLFTGLYSGPYFDLSRMPTNVTAQVSWVRKWDSYIIGVDEVTFISDERFRILKPDQSENEWNLHIKPVRLSDAGVYECQISTKSKMSHYIKLDVVVPIVEIESDIGDIHAQTGSQVRLTCAIRNTLHRPRFVNWYHDNQRLSPNSQTIIHPLKTVPKSDQDPTKSLNSSSSSSTSSSSSPSKSVVPKTNQGGPSFSRGGRDYHSIITLQHVQADQSGRYTCQPSSDVYQLPETHVDLHIVKGETLAAKSERDHNEDSDHLMNSSASQASSTSNGGLGHTSVVLGLGEVLAFTVAISRWPSL